MKLKKIFVAVFAVAVAVLFVACDSPEMAVKAYNKALVNRDAETISKVLSFTKERREARKDKDQTDVEFAQDYIDETRGGQKKIEYRKNLEIIGSRIEGEKAIVIACARPDYLEDKPGEYEFITYTCEKENGKWKIVDEK